MLSALPPFLTSAGTVKLTCHLSEPKSVESSQESSRSVALPCSATDVPAHGWPMVMRKFCMFEALTVETLVLVSIVKLRLSRGDTWLGCWKPKSKNASNATDMKPPIEISHVL